MEIGYDYLDNRLNHVFYRIQKMKSSKHPFHQGVEGPTKYSWKPNDGRAIWGRLAFEL